jgi:hypothetical protein
VKKEVAHGFENALNYSRDDFHEDGHATTLRLIARHALSIPMMVRPNVPWAVTSVPFGPTAC